MFEAGTPSQQPQRPDTLARSRQSSRSKPSPPLGKYNEPAAVAWADWAIPIDVRTTATPQRRVVAIPDCENETSCVDASLRFAGLIGSKGKLKAKCRGSTIVQTGDLLHKNAPNPTVVPYWERLRATAADAGCSLHLVAGNHELEIWQRLQAGAGLGLKRCDQQAVLALIRGMCIFHVEGAMLFIHGYPTVELLRHMQAFHADTGRPLNDYNRDCFHEALGNPNLLARYAYPRRNACRDCLLHDVLSPSSYYRRHGCEVAELLSALGIDLVVHGHRPERSGMQADYELQRWLPGIRMIGNDIQLRLQRLGATVIRQVESGPRDVLFINKASATPTHRAAVRRLLRTPRRADDVRVHDKKAIRDGVVSNFRRGRDQKATAAMPATRSADA